MCELPGQAKTDVRSRSVCYAKLGWDGSHWGKGKACIPTANKRDKSLMVHYLLETKPCMWIMNALEYIPQRAFHFSLKSASEGIVSKI